MAQLNEDKKRDIVGVLWELAQAQATGLLVVRAESSDHQYFCNLYLRAGSVLYAEDGGRDDSLGRLLLRQGRITTNELSKAVERMTDELLETENLRLGEVLIAMGAVGPHEIFEALQLQTRDRILRCLGWAPAEAVFSAGDDHLAGVEDFGSPLWPLLAQAVLCEFDEGRALHCLQPYLDRYPMPSAGAKDVLGAMDLSSSALDFLALADGQRTLGQMLLAFEGERLLAYHFATLLWLSDGLLWQSQAQPIQKTVNRPQPLSPRVAAAKTADPQNIGPTSAEATNAEAKHPKDADEKAAAITARRRRLRAEVFYQRALKLRAQNQLNEALRLFRQAEELDEDALEYGMFAAFTAFQIAPDKDAQTRHGARATQLAQRLVNADGKNLDAHLVLGQTHHGQGRAELALRFLRKALKLDPHNIEAARLVKLIERRMVAPGK